MIKQILFCFLVSTTLYILTTGDKLEDALTKYQKCCATGPNVINKTGCIEKSPDDHACPEGRFKITADDLNYENGTLYQKQSDRDVAMDEILPDFCLTELFHHSQNTKEIVALVCFPPYTDREHIRITSPRILACFTSIAFALVTIAVYFLVPDLRDLQGKCAMNFLACMAMGYLLLTITQMDVLDLPLGSFECDLQAFSLQFWMVAQFFWLNVICINVWRNVRLTHIEMDDSSMFLIYNLYAWGVSAFIVVVTVILHYMPGSLIKPGIGEVSCWLKGQAEYWTFFYGPIIILLLVNTVLFIITALHLWSDYRNMTPSTSIVAHRYKCLLYAKLFFVMGMTWLMEPLAFLADNFKDDPADQYLLFLIFDYINLLQGLFIFIILVLTRKRALRGLAQTSIFGYRCAPASCATLQRLEEDYDEIDQTIDTQSVGIKINE